MDLTKQILTPEELMQLTIPTGVGSLANLLGMTSEDYNQGLTDPTKTKRELIQSGEVYADPRELDRLRGEGNILGTVGQLIGTVAPYEFKPSESALGAIPGVGVGGWIKKMAKGAEPLWATAEGKMAQETIELGLKKLDEHPAMQQLFKSTIAELSLPQEGRIASASPIANIVKFFPKESWKTKSMADIKQTLENAILHEKDHYLIANPDVLAFVKDQYVGIPDTVKDMMKRALPPEAVTRIMATHKDGKSILNHMYLSEFLAYSREASRLAKSTPEAIKNLGTNQLVKDLASYAKTDPAFKKRIDQIAAIPPEVATGASKALDAKRQSGEVNFGLDSLNLFSDDDIAKAVYTAQRKINKVPVEGRIDLKSGLKAVEAERPVVSRSREIVGTGKAYIPTEPTKTKSIRPMYSGIVDENRAFADEITKRAGVSGTKSDEIWAKIMEVLQRGQP